MGRARATITIRDISQMTVTQRKQAADRIAGRGRQSGDKDMRDWCEDLASRVRDARKCREFSDRFVAKLY